MKKSFRKKSLFPNLTKTLMGATAISVVILAFSPVFSMDKDDQKAGKKTAKKTDVQYTGTYKAKPMMSIPQQHAIAAQEAINLGGSRGKIHPVLEPTEGKGQDNLVQIIDEFGQKRMVLESEYFVHNEDCEKDKKWRADYQK